MNRILIILVFIGAIHIGRSQTLPLPPRPSNAISGDAFANLIWSMPREQREEEIYNQIISGNIPDFMRQLKTITVSENNHTVKYFVIPEYAAVGSDSNYFLIPMTPILAQRICNALHCVLPTKKMVDQIYSTSLCKLRPQPIPPTPQMTTVPVFAQHNDSIKALRFPLLNQYPLGTLVGGTKKDVIISNRIYQNLNPNVPKPVVIYGWHQLNGQAIQPVYNGHGETYADYSHGIRLILDSIIVDGITKSFAQVLADPLLSILLSDEGTILKPYYTLSGNITPTPKAFCVVWNSPSSLKISAPTSSGVTYKAFYGTDGIYFNDSTSEFTSDLILNNLQSDSLFFFKLRANSSNGYSIFSEVLAAVTSSSTPQVLIVNGFDRGSAGNTNDFIRQHGKAFKENGHSLSSATNDAVLQGLISLQNYSVVDYILGDESTIDETFSTPEQELVKIYLRNGGKLFVSGAEIAWDLDYKGSTADKDFIHNYLKAQYVNDAPNGQAGVYYMAEPVASNIFDGIGNITFDNGTHGTINVRYPDVINEINGGVNCLKYSNVTYQFAGVFFEGVFPGGTQVGKVITVGFPFETIFPEGTRNLFLEKVISFFNRPVNVDDENEISISTFKLFQNYPNPFNPSTTIKYALPYDSNVKLTVYNSLGEKVKEFVNELQTTGYHEINFNAEGLPSGIYFYILEASSPAGINNFRDVKKLLLVK